MILVLMCSIAVGVKRQEVANCDSWAAQAKTYSLFYLTQDESDMCMAHGIIINAPIEQGN